MKIQKEIRPTIRLIKNVYWAKVKILNWGKHNFMEAKYFGLTKLKDQMYDTFGLRSYCRIMPSVILKEKKEKNVQHNKFNLIWEWKIVMYVRYLEICFMDVLYIIKQFRTNSISVYIRIYRGTCKKVLLLDERAWAEWRVI